MPISNVPIERFLPFFAETGVPVAFLIPTPTGFAKSIMDATFSVRQLFLDAGVHDYDTQEQGPEFKVLVATHLVTEHEVVDTVTSLYRPVTKKGDPRLWIRKLPTYCNPLDLLALIVIEQEIFVFNLSSTPIVNSIYSHGFCYDIISEAIYQGNRTAEELRHMIQLIHNKGFVRSITKGDPGVGDTLEHELGIGRNNRQVPDYHGIELKASRKKKVGSNRNTLFDKTPLWEYALTEKQIIDTYGYWGEDDNGLRRFQLYCTISSQSANSQGLALFYNKTNDMVEVVDLIDERHERTVTAWRMQTLRDRLLEKHPATFWVKASVNIVDDWEYFRYDHIKYTRNPNVSLFSTLIADGIVSVDFLMHYRPNGSIRDHGFPFKIKPENIDLLFPTAIEYDLTGS